MSAPRLLVLEGLRPVDVFGRRGGRGIAWRGSRFVAAGPSEPGGLGLRLDEHLAFAGLINAHDHLHLNLFPSIADDPGAEVVLPVRDASDWVAGMRRRIEREDYRALRQVAVEARAWQGGLKNLLAGATTVLHHDPYLDVFRRRAFPVHVPGPMGWAHSLDLAGQYGPTLVEAWRERRRGRPWFIHLAEGRDERAADAFRRLLATTGPDPWLRLVHGVGLLPADRQAAIAAGMGLVACPSSNHRLLGRPGPLRDFVLAGQAALGTDSRLTGPRDLLEELRFTWTAGLATAEQLLEMVGPSGARSCGLPDRGRLAAGLVADLLVIADDGRPPAQQLCRSCRADLRLVLRRGRPRIADPDLEPLFEATATPWRAVHLDGRPKLLARDLLDPLEMAGLGEPGLDTEPR
jgi:cytosine/adenosine deaminase-related metal-dependent hydrolase